MISGSDRFERARFVEAQLGEPYDDRAPINHRLSAQWDEAEHFPREALDFLEGIGVAKDFVPTGLGGTHRHYDELVALARVVARRDVSVAVTLSAMIWSTLVWIGGDDAQKRRHAESILGFRTPCLAYSEEAHGADLVANDTVARRVEGGYMITGRKWPINRATTGDSVVLLARTGETKEPRALSLFWFEKSALAPRSFRTLPRVPTLGVRGADISGIELEDAFVPDSCRLGKEGAGLEIALKGFHVTRTLCAALSLGAVDAALRTTVRLAQTRRLYGDVLMAIPLVRKTVVDAYALLLAIEVAGLTAARALHTSPSQSATVSATVKHSVPAVAEGIIGRLATIHGARFYMRDHHDAGVMQKAYRDNLLIGIFDGSSPVNLSALATQLPILARFAPASLGGAATDPAREREAFERARLACSFDVDPPAFAPQELDLVSRGDDVVGAVALLLPEIEREIPVGQLRDLLLPMLAAFRTSLVQLHGEIRGVERGPRGRGAASAPALAALAERYAMAHLTAATVHGWWCGRAREAEVRLPWIVVALRQLLPKRDDDARPADLLALDSIYEGLAADVVVRSDRCGGYALEQTIV